MDREIITRSILKNSNEQAWGGKTCPTLRPCCVDSLWSSASAQRTSAGAQEAIKIGVLTVRSGPAKPIGDDILAGIETATKMHGPVLGRADRARRRGEPVQCTGRGDEGDQARSAKQCRRHRGHEHGRDACIAFGCGPARRSDRHFELGLGCHHARTLQQMGIPDQCRRPHVGRVAPGARQADAKAATGEVVHYRP